MRENVVEVERMTEWKRTMCFEAILAFYIRFICRRFADDATHDAAR